MRTPVVIYPPSRNCCEPSAVNEDHDLAVFAGAWMDSMGLVSESESSVLILFSRPGIFGGGVDDVRLCIPFFFFLINLFRKIFFSKRAKERGRGKLF